MVVTPVPVGIDLPAEIDFVNFGFEDQMFKIWIVELGNPDGPTFEIAFEDSVAQRSMDEGKYLSGTPRVLAPGFERTGHIVTVENSEFLEWFHKQSAGIFADKGLIHVAVLTANEWCDVLCWTVPDVRRI